MSVPAGKTMAHGWRREDLRMDEDIIYQGFPYESLLPEDFTPGSPLRATIYVTGQRFDFGRPPAATICNVRGLRSDG